MTIVSRSEVKRMSYDERLKHYEQEKNELFYSVHDMNADEVRDAHEALREKWQV